MQSVLAGLFILTTLAPPTWAQSPVSPGSCHRAGLYEYFLRDKPGVRSAISRAEYNVFEEPGGFRSHGVLDEDDYVVLGRYLKNADGSRAKHLRGKEELYRILNHFGSRAKGVKGVWLEGDNYDEFYKYLAPPYNYTPEKAASMTWTGRTLIAEGYVVKRVEFHGEAPLGDKPIVTPYFELP